MKKNLQLISAIIMMMLCATKIGASEIIYDAPEGDYYACYCQFNGWWVSGTTQNSFPIYGKPTHYIISGDEIYLYNPINLNPFGSVQVESYIKGVAEDGKYRFDLPQTIYEDENGVYDLNLLKYTQTGVDPQGNPIYSYFVDDEHTCIYFAIDEDNNANWQSPGEGQSYAVGLTDADNNWTGYGNVEFKYHYVGDVEAPQIPDEADVETWQLSYKMYGAARSIDVEVAMIDNDIWVKGLNPSYASYLVAHGNIEGDVVTFDMFMGEVIEQGYYNFFAVIDPDEDILVSPTFTYDREANEMTCDYSMCFVNPNLSFYYAMASYTNAKLIGPEKPGSVIENIAGESHVVKTEWYDIAGHKIDNPSNGVYIKVNTDSSGKQTFKKVLVK